MGKSTFFKSIAIALFGRLVLGNRVSQKSYEEFVISRFHKSDFGGKTIKSDSASITLIFEYVESGKSQIIKILRKWIRDGAKVSEKLEILKNNKPPEVQDVDYQSWLNDLIPLGLLPILCFDAEDMSAILNGAGQSDLKDVFKRLLGVHLTEQLGKDLEYYIRQNGGGSDYERLKDEILVKQEIIDHYEEEIAVKKQELENLEDSEKALINDLSGFERKLSSQGGDYAARRPLIKERINQLNGEIEKIENKIRELSTGLLPFILAPGLSQELSHRLEDEYDLYRKKITSDFIEDRVDLIAGKLSDSKIWKENKINKKVSHQIIDHIKDILTNEDKSEDSISLVHGLAEDDILKLQNWIKEAQTSLPDLLLHLTSELKEKRAEKNEHQEYLHRAPDDEELEPIIEKIRLTEEKLGNFRKQLKDKLSELGSLEYKLDEVKREQDRITGRLRVIEKENRKFDLAEKSQLVLRSYVDSFVRIRLEELSDEIVNCFNSICEKEQLLTQAEIDPETFDVQLTDKNEEILNLDDFSMGERQLYGLSLLWALRKISGHELPLLIDTPIARLDQVHRKNFIEYYLPQVSDQVLLFATNFELDDQIINEFKPFVAHKFDLSFDEKDGSTNVSSDSFLYKASNDSRLKVS